VDGKHLMRFQSENAVFKFLQRSVDKAYDSSVRFQPTRPSNLPPPPPIIADNDEGLIQPNFDRINNIDITYVINQQITLKIHSRFQSCFWHETFSTALLRQNMRR